MNEVKKLYRSLANRRIAGVCGGIGEYFNIDPTVVRLLFVLGFFLTGTATFWLYVILWIVVPESNIL